MQLCNKCNYESPESDRFCRQCGGQLSIENEFTPTMTFSQAKAESNPPMVASVGTGRFPPSVGDTIAGNTERYYTPPQYTQAPVTVERIQIPDPPKTSSGSWFTSFSGFMKGAFAFLLIAGLIFTTGLSVFFSQEARRERDRRYEQETRTRQRAGRENANDRAQDAWSQMEEALILAQEAAEKAANAGATLTISDERPIDLDKYTFPNADIEAKVTKQGHEALSLVTRQNFEAVQDFYEKKIGKPVLQLAEDQRKRNLFQSSTQPNILVKVEEVDRGRVKITILHSFLRFPRFIEQAKM